MKNRGLRKLRKEYPKFIYKKYSYQIFKKDLAIFFNFGIEPNISFQPKVVIKNINKSDIKRAGDRVLNNLVFHLGLIEILSYWKATCSPIIEIQAGHLNKEQIRWLKNLIIRGMGQFFYENKINFKKPKFLKIKTVPKNNSDKNFYSKNLKNRLLVPMGGGKDSAVTLEILRKAKKNISCFSLNPTEAAKNIMKIGGCGKPIIIERKIDKNLLELNRTGFLNGHTPFSAYLAFLSVLSAAIFDYKYIAFSNERSSNEGNVRYLGKIINHQYSKSFDFERKFRKYSKKYLIKDVEYFSFLRPLYEIQIAKIFSRFPKYFPIFLSCNETHKTCSGRKKPTKKWCGKCPKCLFIFAILYLFLENGQLIKIFGQNLFRKRGLLPLMEELIGEKRFKPFECVGTKKESLIAFYLSWKKAMTKREKPFLLQYFERKILPNYPNLNKESKGILKTWNNQNNLPKDFNRILRSGVKNR